MRLERWDTPFTDLPALRIRVMIEGRPQHGEGVTLIVEPSGTEAYPKYLVRFPSVSAFVHLEETLTPRTGGPDDGDAHASACVWSGSPWVRAQDDGEAPADRHYVVFGDDRVIEVVSRSEPEVETVTSPQVLELRHAI